MVSLLPPPVWLQYVRGILRQPQIRGTGRTLVVVVRDTYIYYHFTALAGSDLAKQLQDEGLRHVPGQIPHVPAGTKTQSVQSWRRRE